MFRVWKAKVGVGEKKKNIFPVYKNMRQHQLRNYHVLSPLYFMILSNPYKVITMCGYLYYPLTQTGKVGVRKDGGSEQSHTVPCVMKPGRELRAAAPGEEALNQRVLLLLQRDY